MNRLALTLPLLMFLAATTLAHSAPGDKKLEGAVIGVLGIENLVMRMAQTCSRVNASAADTYNGAANDWRRRNGETVALAKRVLGQAFDESMQSLINLGVQAKNDGSFNAVMKAQPAAQARWCDRSAGEINQGRLDVHNNSKLTTPLAAYGQP
ncbi:hypothetical protein [Nitrogeniibacter aestuarii]|uniref:hypothetical protein n=1 Tax=Nitrogeniibacter aestuarii TaxID=2815343 RepID=UPI001D12EE3C|nr:hypothetical protein [Nitrogeniibacter aestuarii]